MSARPPEPRREPRAGCSPVPRALLVAAPDFRPLRAFVADASPGGLGLVLGEPVAAGAEAAVELPGLLPGWTLGRAGRVAHCTTRTDGTWLVGLALRTALGPAELEALRAWGAAPGGQGQPPEPVP